LYLSAAKEPKFFLTDGPPPTRGGGPGDVQTLRLPKMSSGQVSALRSVCRSPSVVAQADHVDVVARQAVTARR
jgi:hypothetical protein